MMSNLTRLMTPYLYWGNGHHSGVWVRKALLTSGYVGVKLGLRHKLFPDDLYMIQAIFSFSSSQTRA
jgi:hypothetical protein